MSNGNGIDPRKKKGKASSYDDNFLDKLAESDQYKQWAADKTRVRAATSNAFDTERHRVAFDSSNQDEVDEGINPFLNQFVDLEAEDPYEEIRAANQTGIEQAAKIAPRAAVKAAAEIAKIPGVIGGLAAAPFAAEGEGYDTAFNNQWIKAIEGIEHNLKEDLMPIYTAKAVKEGNLWANISSTSFWATEGADGIGFIAGMMAPGAGFELLGLGGKLIKAASNSQRLSRLTSMAGKAEEGTKALKLMGVTGKNIDSALAVTANTFLEAGAEAKGVGDDLDAKKPQFVENYTKSPEYNQRVDAKLAELDQQRRSGAISDDDYDQMSMSVREDVIESAFKEQRALAMRDTFVTNVGILIGPNALMHKAIWGKAAQKFEKTTEEGLKGVAKRAGKMGQRVGGAFVTEGLWEEGSQTTAQNMFVQQALRGELGKSKKRGLDRADEFIGDFTNEYLNTLSSVDGQKAIFLGGALGGPMMSYTGRKQDVANRKRTNAILENIDSRVLAFNKQFENDIFKKKEDGSFEYVKDENGLETTERVLDNKKVAEVARNMNFSEQQAALFDFAIQTGNKEVVDQIKRQAIFNLIMPSVHNGEAGLQALEQRLESDAKFNEIAQRDYRADEKDNSKSFVKETLEGARWLQKQKERFDAFSNDVIQLDNEDATNEDKEDFLNDLSSSYLNTKYALRNAEKDLENLNEKRKAIFEEAGADELYDPTAEFPLAKMKGETITNKPIEERAERTKQLLETNETLRQIDEQYREKQKEVAAHKKDIAGIWQASQPIADAFNKYVAGRRKAEKEMSDEKVAEAQELIDGIDAVETKDELAQLLLPQRATPAPEGTHQEEEAVYNRRTQEGLIQEASKSIAQDDSTANLKANLEKLKAVSIGSSALNKIVAEIEDKLNERIENQEAFKEELAELMEEHYEKAKALEDITKERQEKLNELIETQRLLNEHLSMVDRKPRGRNAKVLKAAIVEAENELKRTEEKIDQLNKEIEFLEGEVKRIDKDIQTIFNRYDQVSQLEFGSIEDILKYLNNSKDLFKEHRNDLGILLSHRFGTERRIEEIEDTVDALEKYKGVLKQTLDTYAEMQGKIKPGTDPANLKFVKEEFIKTSRDLQNAKKDLADHQAKLKRLNKAIIDKQALQAINEEVAFWEDVQKFKEKRVNPLANNPFIKKKIAEKEQQLQEEEDFNQQVEEEFHNNITEEEIVNNPEDVEEVVTPPVSEDHNGEYDSESTDIPEDETSDEDLPDPDMEDEDDVDDLLESERTGAKVLSTNRETGEALFGVEDEETGEVKSILDPFVAYERTPRDKRNDKVTFSLGNGTSKDNKKALEIFSELKDREPSNDEIKFLEKYLPIKVNITDDKGKTVHSFIEDSKSPNDQYKAETLPLRRNIVREAIINKSLDGITSNIVEQFPGVLKIDPKTYTTYTDKDGIERKAFVEGNDIFSLQVFDGMTEDEKIDYFQENTGYVNWEGQLMSTVSPKQALGPQYGVQNKGEVFLRVPMNNGKKVWLKLNVNKISEEKSEAVYEMVKALSSVSQTIGKQTSFQAMTVGKFFEVLDKNNPELSARLQATLANEIKFIKKWNKGDERNESLSRFLDLIVYHKSENVKTGFRLSKDGNLHLGELAHHLMDGMGFGHALTITKDELASTEAKEVVMKYLQYKRNNVLITKDSAEQFVFRNRDYVRFLLNKDNPVLSTNAVVNQPTFQGYSNVYLNREVTNSKPAPVAKQQPASKPSDTVVEPITKNPFKLDIDSMLGNEVRVFSNSPEFSSVEKAFEVIRLQYLIWHKSSTATNEKQAEVESVIDEMLATNDISKIKKLGQKVKFTPEQLSEWNKDSNAILKTLNELSAKDKKEPPVPKDPVDRSRVSSIGAQVNLKTKSGGTGVIIEDRQNSWMVEKSDGTVVQVLKTNVEYLDEIDESKTKEPVTDTSGVNKASKAAFDAARAAAAAKKDPANKQEVKTDVQLLTEAFNTKDEDTQAEIVYDLTESLGISDQYTSTDKFNPENLNNTFKELIDIAKAHNKSIDDIKKLCGF